MLHSRMVVVGLVLGGCPAGDGGDTDAGTSGATTQDVGTTTDVAPTTGGMAVGCGGGGIGAAFSWASAPGPGTATCTRITDASLALDCSGDFSGIFTLMLANGGQLGIVPGDELEVDHRVTEDGAWLRIRGQNQWYVVAGQGPTLAPPDAPVDWFHPNVAVAVVASNCAPTACDDGSGDQTVGAAVSFGQGDNVAVLAAGKDGSVPGEFGGESYHAAVSEAHTGVCGGGAAQAGVDVLAYSVVSSGLL